VNSRGEEGRKPLKIAFVLHADGLEGTGRSHIEMVGELIDSGNVVHTFLPQDQSGLKSILVNMGSEVHVVGDLPWWTTASNMSVANLISYKLVESLKELDPNLIVTQTGVVPQGAIAAKILNKPHVWYLREYINLDHNLRIPFRKEAFSSIVLELSEKVITNSEEIARYFYSETNSNIQVIHPLNLKFKPSQSQKIPSKSIRLGVVGTMSENKGQLIALEALKHLVENGLNVSLEIYGGSNESYLQKVTSFIEDNRLKSFVNIHGFVADRDEIYSNIDILLVPSIFEAYGRTALEGMQYSIPVIISDSAAMSASFLDKEICLGFESQNSLSLAEGITLLTSNADFCSNLTLNASKFLSDESTNLGSSKINKLFSEVVSNFDSENQNHDLSKILIEIYRLTEDHSRLTDDHSRLTEDHSRLTEDHSRLTEDHSRLTEDHSRLTEDHSRLTEDHSRLTEDHSRLTEEIAAIHSSEFWRATKPIRRFIGVIRVLLNRD
jgi:glycosyltransferase involved in cell wall biosynthesis